MPRPFEESLLSGINTGSSMFSRLMQPILERERQAQLEKHFQQQAALQRAKDAQLERHFQQEFGLRQAAAGRNAALFDYRLQELKDKHAAAEFERDIRNRIMEAASPPEQSSQISNVFSGGGISPEGQEPSNDVHMNKKSINGIPLEYLMQAITAKSLGIPIPKMGGENAYQGVAREARDLERLKSEVGENSPVYLNAQKLFDAKLQAQEDLSDVRGRTIGGLKTGERWMFDPETGARVGKEIPLTAKERDEYRGRGFFNNIFPYISQGLSPLSGKGSYSKISNAASQYGRNPQATKLIDDFLLGKKLLTAGTVKESATLGSGKQKIIMKQLGDSLDSSDIPKTMTNIIKQFSLPPEAAIKADKRFQEILNESTSAAERSVPAFQKQYFEPEKFQNDKKYLRDKKNMGDSLVIVIDPNGKKFETTEENAAHLPEGWKRG